MHRPCHPLSNRSGLQDLRAVLAAWGWLRSTAAAPAAGAGPCQACQRRCSSEASACRCGVDLRRTVQFLSAHMHLSAHFTEACLIPKPCRCSQRRLCGHRLSQAPKWPCCRRDQRTPRGQQEPSRIRYQPRAGGGKRIASGPGYIRAANIPTPHGPPVRPCHRGQDEISVCCCRVLAELSELSLCEDWGWDQ